MFTENAFALLEGLSATPTKAFYEQHKNDISQVVTYAEVKGCKNAILVYPQDLESGLNERLGDIRVRSLAFKIDGDLESAGRSFIERLGLEKMVLGAFVAC